MNSMSPFLRALSYGALLALVSGLVLSAVGAAEGFFLAAAVAVGIATTLFDKEGFYGEPHPFRRRPR